MIIRRESNKVRFANVAKYLAHIICHINMEIERTNKLLNLLKEKGLITEEECSELKVDLNEVEIMNNLKKIRKHM